MEQKYNLSQISSDETAYFEVINKYIWDTVLREHDPNIPESHQEIYTLKIPEPHHWTMAYLRNLLGFKSKAWEPFERNWVMHKYVLKGGVLSIVVKKNVSKDTYIFYNTTAQEILALQSLGLTKSQALTSSVIEKIGCYHLLTNERKIKSHIVTHKTQLKKYLVTQTQNFVRLLQPIECLISNYHEISNAQYLVQVKTKLDTLAIQLEQQLHVLNKLLQQEMPFSPETIEDAKQHLHLDLELLTLFLKYDKNFLVTQKVNLATTIKNIKNFERSLSQHFSLQGISFKLQEFLRYSLNEIIRNTKLHNAQITANSDDSLDEGKLKEYLTESDKIISYYIFDQLNPITPPHQSDFRTNEAGDNPILYQSRYHCGHSKQDLEKLLLAITTLEDARQPAPEKAVKIVKSAAWNNFSTSTKNQKLKRFAAWLLTLICHAPLGLANIIVTTLTGKAPIATWMHKIENSIRRLFKIQENYDHNFFKFAEKLGVNNVYTSTIIGQMLHKVLNEFTGVIIQAPKLIFQKVVEQFKLLKNDFITGFWGKLYRKKHPPSYKNEEQNKTSLSIETRERLSQWINNAKQLNQIKRSNIFSEPISFAKPRTALDPYFPHDILSSLIGGLEGFCNFFKDHIFEKHPITAFIASLAYIIGGAAVISPAALGALLAKLGFTHTQIFTITKTLQDVGAPLAKGHRSQAIASGFTLAKACGVTINTASQGFDSALFHLIDEVRKDPLIYGAGLIIAYGCGHLITDVAHIPFITNYFREEIGTVPALCKIMIGAKLGLISLETALPEDEEHKSILAHFIGDVTNNLMIGFRMVASIVTWSKEPWVDFSRQIVKTFGIILNAFNRLAVLTAQLLLQFPKTMLDVGSTVYIAIAKLCHTLVFFRKKETHQVPTVNNVLRAKDFALHKGYQASFFVRENTARRLERLYGTAVKKVEQEEKRTSTSHAHMLTQLQKLYHSDKVMDIATKEQTITPLCRENTPWALEGVSENDDVPPPSADSDTRILSPSHNTPRVSYRQRHTL